MVNRGTDKKMQSINTESSGVQRVCGRKGRGKAITGKDYPKRHQTVTKYDNLLHYRGPSLNATPQYRPLNQGVNNEVDPVKSYAGAGSIHSRSNKKRRGPRGGVTTPFPVKLFRLLESEKHREIISWQPHGRCFILRKPKDFLEKVMPFYFRQSKLTSFQRQLNLYGFRRLTSSGPDKGGYYHERFLRDKPALCEGMLRIRIKGTGAKSPNNPETEPNFYEIESLSNQTHSPIIKSNQLSPPMFYYQSSFNANKNTNYYSMASPSFPNKIKNITSSHVCTAPTLPQTTQSVDPASFGSNPPTLHSCSSSASLIGKSRNSFSPASERNPEGAKVPDTLTFEGKGFHYIDSDFLLNDLKPNLSNPTPPVQEVSFPPSHVNYSSDSDAACDPVFTFDWY